MRSNCDCAAGYSGSGCEKREGPAGTGPSGGATATQGKEEPQKALDNRHVRTYEWTEGGCRRVEGCRELGWGEGGVVGGAAALLRRGLSAGVTGDAFLTTANVGAPCLASASALLNVNKSVCEPTCAPACQKTLSKMLTDCENKARETARGCCLPLGLNRRRCQVHPVEDSISGNLAKQSVAGVVLKTFQDMDWATGQPPVRARRLSLPFALPSWQPGQARCEGQGVAVWRRAAGLHRARDVTPGVRLPDGGARL